MDGTINSEAGRYNFSPRNLPSFLKEGTEMNCGACCGLGRVIAFQPTFDPVTLVCDECAGSGLTPASFDVYIESDGYDDDSSGLVVIQPVDQVPKSAKVGAVEVDRNPFEIQSVIVRNLAS